MFLVIFVTTSCEKNDEKVKLRINKMENNIKKLKKTNKLQAIKLQNLMNELSTCKASKVKYVEVTQEFDVIDEASGSNGNTVRSPKYTKVQNKIEESKELETVQNKKVIEKPKNVFPYPSSIKGACKKSDINRVFHNLRPYFKKCFSNNKIKRGELGYSWQINENGDVENIKVIKNNIFNRNLSNCLNLVLKSGRYNSPDEGICELSYIFKL